MCSVWGQQLCVKMLVLCRGGRGLVYVWVRGGAVKVGGHKEAVIPCFVLKHGRGLALEARRPLQS